MKNKITKYNAKYHNTTINKVTKYDTKYHNTIMNNVTKYKSNMQQIYIESKRLKLGSGTDQFGVEMSKF